MDGVTAAPSQTGLLLAPYLVNKEQRTIRTGNRAHPKGPTPTSR